MGEIKLKKNLKHWFILKCVN